MSIVKTCLQPIPGEGIQLRLLTEHDLALTLAWRNRDEARCQFRHSEKIAMNDHQAWFARQQSLHDRYYFIVENNDGHQAIGQVGIYNIDVQTQSAEVGTFVVAPESAGRGLMKRGINTLTDWAFDVLKLTRVTLQVFATNHRAIRLYEACG